MDEDTLRRLEALRLATQVRPILEKQDIIAFAESFDAFLRGEKTEEQSA